MNTVTPMNSPDDPELEQLLRETLTEEAESVNPSPGLAAIRARAGRENRPRALFRGLVAATTVAVVGAAVTIGVVVNRQAPTFDEAVPMATHSEAGATPTPTPSPSTTPPDSTTPVPPPLDSEASRAEGALPVFWL